RTGRRARARRRQTRRPPTPVPGASKGPPSIPPRRAELLLFWTSSVPWPSSLATLPRACRRLSERAEGTAVAPRMLTPITQRASACGSDGHAGDRARLSGRLGDGELDDLGVPAVGVDDGAHGTRAGRSPVIAVVNGRRDLKDGRGDRSRRQVGR